ncbi:hypothetical protein [Pseudooceanicola nitratireducens]|uniref:hypothetical protein n=1 Tax=Pseudooceanicola nitratireducens TaxID=517719 RepID=UPI003341CEED
MTLDRATKTEGHDCQELFGILIGPTDCTIRKARPFLGRAFSIGADGARPDNATPKLLILNCAASKIESDVMSGTSRLKVAGELIVIRTDRPSGWVQHTIVWLNTQDLPFDSYCLGVASQGEASSSEVWRRAQTEMQNGGQGYLQCAPGDFQRAVRSVGCKAFGKGFLAVCACRLPVPAAGR